MADISKLREDVEWWRVEIDIRKRKVEEAIEKYETRKRELASAIAETNSSKK